MIAPRYRSARLLYVLPALFFLTIAHIALAEEEINVTEIAPNLLVLPTSTGNVIALLGKDGALLVGTPSATSTKRIDAILTARKSHVRYLVVFPEDRMQSQGDAGWGKQGAFVAMQENALQRLGGDTMGAPPAPPAQFIQLGVDRPHIAFSEVLAFDLNGESIHIVHQKPGYSNADAIAHFHVAKLVYLGEVFPGDGYPRIDPAQGGTIDGLINTLDGWTDPTFKIVPARGKVTDGASVKAFRDMILSVRDRIENMIKAGRTESEIVSQHPTVEFDGQWGHGRVSPDEFVHEIYRELQKK